MNSIWLIIKKHMWSYVFIIPMFLLFIAFTFYPLMASAYYTFFNWDGIGVPADFVGFKNYINIASDPFFWNAFKNTIIYTVILVPIQVSLALLLATVLNSKWLKARYIFGAIFFLPVVSTAAIVGIVVSILISVGGKNINAILINFGFINSSIDWLGDHRTALGLIILVGVWISLGYPIIYFLAALQSVKQELYDAAMLDGANALKLFWYITLPSIRPIFFVILFITTLYSLRVFDIIQTMTRGGPYYATDVVSTYIYRMAFYTTERGEAFARIGYASAAAFFLGLLIMGISIFQFIAIRYLYKQRSEGKFINR